MDYEYPKNANNTLPMRVDVKLLKELEQRRPDMIFPKGSIITVGEATAQRLIDAGIAEMVYPSAAKESPKKPKRKSKKPKSNAVELPKVPPVKDAKKN